MINEQARYDQIEAYLKGKMTNEERVSFENEMANDPTLNEAVMLQKVALDVLRYDHSNELKELIDQKGKTYKPKNLNKWWLFGSLGFVLISSAVVLFYANSTVNPVEKDTKNEAPIVIEDKADEVTDHHNNHPEKLKSQGVNEEKPKTTEAVNVSKTDDEQGIASVNQENPVEEVVEQEDSNKESKANDDNPLKTSENTVSTVDCSEVPKVTFHIEPAFAQTKTGVVTITNHSDMYLSYALIPFEENYVQQKQFDGLEAGMYQLKAKTEQCDYEIAILDVPETVCLKEKDMSFNISYERSLNIPIAESASGNMVIINKSGVEVYSRSFEKTNKLTWDGSYTNGNATQQGLHKMIIKTTKETCLYNVVVAK